ncbi:MAG: methyltransferase [Rhodanobacter sp.]
MTAAGYFADAPQDALETLRGPVDAGQVILPPGRDVLFLGARAGRWAHDLARPGWICEQSFLPFADELGRLGLQVRTPDPDETFSLVMLLPRRQRDERRAMFGRALRHLAAGGTLLASVANVEGARSAESDLARLAGPVQQVSKHKCRAFWVAPDPAGVDQNLLEAWLALDAPRTIIGGYFSRPGLFAWDHVDPGSALLAECLPANLGGRVADLGAGYGYLGAQVLARCPQVSALDLYEAEQRALEPARINLQHALRVATEQHGRRAVALDVRWHDVTLGLPHRYDAIVSNPPFHQGRADLPQLGLAFIRSAADALEVDGRLLIVANRHLPYEALLRSRFHEVHALAGRDGFKVIEAHGVRK